MKKILVIVSFLILIVFVSFSALGQPENQDNVGLAYQCLENQIDDKTEEELSLSEAVFSTLALGSDSKLQNVIADHKRLGESCYGSGSTCTILETAQVLLAQNRIGSNTENIESWLLDKKEAATELDWFLLIDIQNHLDSTCEIKYDGGINDILVSDDLTLSGNPGQCLKIAQGGFWLQISDSCLDQEYEVSCDEDFITTLIYKQEDANTVYVSPNTHSAVALGNVKEIVNASCFGINGVCDYEGSLWASMALQKTGKEIKTYLPFLFAAAQDNPDLFPDSFLHVMTQGQEQYTKITQSLKQNKFWEAPATKYNRFYDSALGMLSLQSAVSTELGLSETYFLQIQTTDGCWNNNNIRDTAFLLYGGWQRSSVPGSGPVFESCEDNGFYCGGQFDCVEAGGTQALLDGYVCGNQLEHCCSAPLVFPSCEFELGGDLCDLTTETCSGDTGPSLEGTCCFGNCVPKQTQTSCELAGDSCRFSCGTGEEQTTDSCGSNSGLSCCMIVLDPDRGLGLWIYVIVLVILIGLVVLGIINRKKLQIWVYKMKAKWGAGKSRAQVRRPIRRGIPPPRRRFGPGPGSPSQQQPRRPPRPPPMGQGAAKPKRDTDKELDDTLKKLRDMSK